MPRYKITFSYDGSNFHGYQVQPKLRTIQGELERAVSYLNRQTKTSVQSSGRTDGGVHALAQVAHFDLDVLVKPYNLRNALNKRLHGEIYIRSLEIVNSDFHARYDAKKKVYSYYINTRWYTPVLRQYVLQLGHTLDLEVMKDVASVFLGEHDFRCLSYQAKDKLNCVRTIDDIRIVDMNGIVKITVSGNGFLRKMVRNIVSILIKVGEGKMTKTEVLDLLTTGIKRNPVKCVDACGLYLDEVLYGDCDGL